MRVLVTGLNGFTGGYLRKEVQAQGYEVVGLTCDLTQPEAVLSEVQKLKPEVVLHLAAIAYVGHGSPNAFYDVNLVGTRNLLDAISRHAPNVESIMLASSANIYGNSSAGALNEETPAEPANDYAVSKHAMERMAHLWIDRLPLFIVRPFNYTGVGQSRNFLIPKIVSHFQTRSATIELGNLEVWREFGDVRSVASIYRNLIEKNPVGETINVCTGKAYSLQDVIRLCESFTGHSLNVEVNPDYVRPNEVRELTGDNTKLKMLIGNWQHYEFEETLAWMLAEGSF